MSQPRNNHKRQRRNTRHAVHNAKRRAARKQRASGRRTRPDNAKRRYPTALGQGAAMLGTMMILGDHMFRPGIPARQRQKIG
jgi:hypothetical protein